MSNISMCSPYRLIWHSMHYADFLRAAHISVFVLFLSQRLLSSLYKVFSKIISVIACFIYIIFVRSFHLSVIVGEIMNFLAYLFAPATLVTPLGALSVICRQGHITYRLLYNSFGFLFQTHRRLQMLFGLFLC